jgi:hypothetical protein
VVKELAAFDAVIHVASKKPRAPAATTVVVPAELFPNGL